MFQLNICWVNTIKYNISNGAPAPEALTNRFVENMHKIDHYWMIHANDIDLNHIGEQTLGSTLIEIIDPVIEYTRYMQQIFDFEAIRMDL